VGAASHGVTTGQPSARQAMGGRDTVTVEHGNMKRQQQHATCLRLSDNEHNHCHPPRPSAGHLLEFQSTPPQYCPPLPRATASVQSSTYRPHSLQPIINPPPVQLPAVTYTQLQGMHQQGSLSRHAPSSTPHSGTVPPVPQLDIPTDKA
jgi:hypothetical protein